MRHRILLLLCSLLQPSPALAQDKPLPPGEAPKHMTLPDGFRATLFAGEPDVVQPIAFTIDDRGRLWVAECFSYPQWQKDGKEGKDRILIFEDRDGDGHFDTCKVFYDKVANISGIQVGFGGVWVCATPNLLFIPDRNGDDVPDGPPDVVLDGWNLLQAQHNVFNSLTWGPDGWLYGCNGIQSKSKVGKPGTPEQDRIELNCGVWRYHPTRQQFEVVATGTTNPWGLDFDDYGQMFITNCVIGHLWHVVPGAHFQRMYGQDFNPHWYSLLDSCADHLHWAGGPWQSSRGGQGKHSEAGGGHAHVGAMVYLGDNWPDRYRNGVFMCNIHGNRVNHDILERRGSGYVAHHGKDFLLANDPWFRGLALQYGPDGGVFVSDWTDTGECHNSITVDRSNGRIYKITYGNVSPVHEDLAKLSDAELVQRQLHKNDWHVRHARRLLQERAAAGKLDRQTHDRLRKILREHADVTRKLRALWALHVTGGLDEPLKRELLDSPHEFIRGWVVQVALEDRRPSVPLLKLAEMAVKDPAPLVRLYLASALQRLGTEQRRAIAMGLLQHAEDTHDAYLPLVIWYGIEPLASADPIGFVDLIPAAKIPLIREYIARRMSHFSSGLDRLVRLLGQVNDAAIERDMLSGIQEALKGQRSVPMPEGWPTVMRKFDHSPERAVREKALVQSVQFGDEHALETLRKAIVDKTTAAAFRRTALQALLDHKDPRLVPLLHALIAERGMRSPALRALAAYSDEATPQVILGHYASFNEEEKSDAIHTLTSRPAYALALLEGVERGLIPRHDLSAFTVRQMLAFHDKPIQDKLARVWGTIRPASQEKAALMAFYKGLLKFDYLSSADRSHGRLIYARTCAACHRLFGEGGDVGPDLTGSQRANLDYVLENVLDPSAIVAQDYQVTVLETKDGRILTGIIKQENDKTVTVRTQNDSIIVPKDEIEMRKRSPLSMMPDGLFSQLKNEEVRDLIAYLASPTQVPLPEEKPGVLKNPSPLRP
jgi:putative membrane-bound dehydrogenase-like protein